MSLYNQDKFDFLKGVLGAKNKISFPIISKPPTPPTLPPKKYLTSPLTKKWSPFFYNSLKKDINKRSKLFSRRIKEIKEGLTMPSPSRVPIGSGKNMVAAIMFFDLENFTARSATLGNENTLYALNNIIPPIIKIIKHWNGEIEKNTGDGVMAIFGTETRNDFIIARDAIEVAMAIRYTMRDSINPILESKDIQGFNFRIGIDMDSVLIANIGINNNSFLTIVGGAANRASKLQNLASSNDIFVGDNLFRNFKPIVQELCKERMNESWTWSYQDTKTPYRFFEFTGDWPNPVEWKKIKTTGR